MDIVTFVALSRDSIELLDTAIASDNEGNYYVFTLYDAGDIEVGDVIRGEFEGSFYSFGPVYCVTKKKEIKISLECAKVPLESAAKEFLNQTGTPAEISFVSGVRIITDVPDKIRQITDEISRN